MPYHHRSTNPNIQQDGWIGGSTAWQPRTPRRFVLSYVKGICIVKKYKDIDDLEQRINNAVSTITEIVLQAHGWNCSFG